MQILYILGSTRSGTSALRNAIAQTRFSGYGEGHLVPLLQEIVSTVAKEKAQGIGSDVDGTGLYRLRENVFIRYLFHAYESYLVEDVGSSSIIDKTPTINPILAAPLLNKFHKDAKFIHCARRHVDNIESKRKKFPERTIVQHCVEWVECNEAWMYVRDLLDGNYFDFDFYDLVNNTENLCERLGVYLALTKNEVFSVNEYLGSMRPQGSADRDLAKYIKFDQLDWSDREKDEFLRICGPVGSKMGYGLDEYYA